jgi:hypothetical protein
MTEKSKEDVVEPSMDVGIPCLPNSLLSDTFRARGAEAIKIQESIINYSNKMWMIRTVSSYGASVAFALISALLIIWAPDSRTVAADIVAAALLLLAAGLAGYTRFAAKLPGGMEMTAASERSN